MAVLGAATPLSWTTVTAADRSVDGRRGLSSAVLEAAPLVGPEVRLSARVHEGLTASEVEALSPRSSLSWPAPTRADLNLYVVAR